MQRSLLLKIAARAKSEGLVDLAVRYNPLARGCALKALRHFDQNSAEERLRSTLQAARKSAYGADKGEAFAQWPILTKETLRDRSRTLINPSVFFRIPAASGGTTGMPLKLWRSLECVAAEQLFLDALLKPYGLSMRSKMAVLRADPVKPAHDTEPPYGVLSHRGKRLTLSSAHLNSKTLPWYIETLAGFAPSILWVYPSAALNLHTLLLHAGQRLDIPVILASSEALSETSHAALANSFGATLINYYGQAERVCLAYSTKPGEFYFHPAYGHVELMPGPEDNTMKIIATSYWNNAMPLVRYDTGDLLSVPAGATPENLKKIVCGEQSFQAIAGRDSEYLLTREGMRIIGLNHIPREVNNIAHIQLFQPDYDTLLIKVIPLPGYTDADGRRLKEQAKAKVGNTMEITVDTVERLTPTVRGKVPYVIRTVT